MSRDTRWWAPGDLSAFFGLLTDNLTQLLVCAALLVGGFGFPAEVVLGRMLPGTAFGVLLGDLAYAWMGARLSRKLGRPVTAMPLGIDTPSLYAVCFLLLGPLFQGFARTMTPEAAGVRAWHAGMALLVLSGVFKLALAPFGNAVRRLFPRAALLGPLAGIAVGLIALLPCLEVFETPAVGLPVLALVLAVLVGGWRTPFGIPGAFLGVVGGSLLYFALPGHDLPPLPPLHLSLPLPTLGFLDGMRDALPLLPVALPFALVTVVGGIDCTESAAVAGDEYDTRAVLGVEGAATLLAGLFGGVIQTTPYIGHPAYKRMGGRSGYALLTALAIGLGAALGALPACTALLPKVVLVPILCFVGIEIAAQAFRASETRHGPAVALAFVPCLAYLLLISCASFHPMVAQSAGRTGEVVRLLGNGFVVSAFLWGAAAAWLIDRRAVLAGGALLLCAALSATGVIHSPRPDGALLTPWEGLPADSLQIVLGYAGAAAVVLLLAPLQAKEAHA